MGVVERKVMLEKVSIFSHPAWGEKEKKKKRQRGGGGRGKSQHVSRIDCGEGEDFDLFASSRPGGKKRKRSGLDLLVREKKRSLDSFPGEFHFVLQIGEKRKEGEVILSNSAKREKECSVLSIPALGEEKRE